MKRDLDIQWENSTVPLPLKSFVKPSKPLLPLVINVGGKQKK
jgi:hypothetical protein